MAEKSEEAARRIAKARREGVTRLSLDGLGLTEVPPEIASLTQLQHLWLDNNQLTTLPPYRSMPRPGSSSSSTGPGKPRS